MHCRDKSYDWWWMGPSLESHSCRASPGNHALTPSGVSLHLTSSAGQFPTQVSRCTLPAQSPLLPHMVTPSLLQPKENRRKFWVAAANPSVLLKALSSNPPLGFSLLALQQLDLNSTEESPDLWAPTHLFSPAAEQPLPTVWFYSLDLLLSISSNFVPPPHLENHRG